MRIGIVCFAWGKEHRGGLETHVSGLAKLLSDYGHQVFIHCIDDKTVENQYHQKGRWEGKLHIEQTNYNYSDTRCLFDSQRVPQAEIILKKWINYNKLNKDCTTKASYQINLESNNCFSRPGCANP